MAFIEKPATSICTNETEKDIRLAAREIGKITGRIEIDEILDKIFGSFCIGK